MHVLTIFLREVVFCITEKKIIKTTGTLIQIIFKNNIS